MNGFFVFYAFSVPRLQGLKLTEKTLSKLPCFWGPRLNIMSEEDNVWDKGRWSFVKEVKFDFMTNYIFRHMQEAISIEGKTFVELGSGLGRLSYLLLKAGAKKVILVDSSSKAVSLTQQVFKGESPEGFELVQEDLFEYEPKEKIDVSFSSGVIEHFKDGTRFDIIKKHIDVAAECSLILHPTDTPYATFFNNFPVSIKLYGYQESFSDKEMDDYLDRLDKVKSHYHKRFHTFYTVPFLHNFGALNEFIDPMSSRLGGFTLTKASLGKG